MEAKYPAITVVTQVYNAAAFLEETIDSVLCQTFTGFEYLLLDDGSTDNSEEIIRKYKDPRISYIRCPHDFIGTQNKSFELAKGKYIAQLDHDDIMVPSRLEVQYQFMEAHPDIAACGGYMQVFGKKEYLWTNPLKHDEIIEKMITYNPVHNSTIFYRREFLTTHQVKFERGYSYTSDYKIFTEIAKTGKLENLPVVLTKYRSSDKQATALYESEMGVAGFKTQHEMVDYFVSQLDDDNKYMKIAKHNFAPVMDKLRRSNHIRQSTYFISMYELITGLRRFKTSSTLFLPLMTITITFCEFSLFSASF